MSPHLAAFLYPSMNDTDERAICLLQNVDEEVIGETENVEVVRTFYTYRPTPKGDVKVWYADAEFGFYEGLPKRVADLNATHIDVKVRSQNPLESVQRRPDSCFLPICLVSEKIGHQPQG